MENQQRFGNIGLVGRGSQSLGSFKSSQAGILWKKLGGGKTVEIKPDDMYEVCWCVTTAGNQLKIRKETGAMISFLGFREKDIVGIKEFCQEQFGKELLEEEQSVLGKNWGNIQIRGSSLIFVVDGKSSFEIPLTDVSMAHQVKDEVQLEFAEDDTALNDKCDALVGMSFHVPQSCDDWKPEEGKDDKPSKVLLERLLQYTDGGTASSEDAMASFDQAIVLYPRGRYTIEIHQSALMLLGQTNDFKVRYTSIGRIFILPKPLSNQTMVVFSVDPAIRKGQTHYPFILCQFDNTQHSNIELKIKEEEFQKINAGLDEKRKLQKTYAYPTYECLARIIKSMAQVKVSKPGSFLAHDGISSCFRCSYRADDGFLYCLEHVFIFVHKPVLLIAFEEIDNVEFLRQGGMLAASAKTFDFSVRMKWNTDTEYSFRNIQKVEYQHLFRFVQNKGLKVDNFGDMASGNQGRMQGIDVGDTVDPGIARAGIEDEDEEGDEDFNAGSGDESEGESSSEDGESDAEMIDETMEGGKIIGHKQVEGKRESPEKKSTPPKKKAKVGESQQQKEGGQKAGRKKKDKDAPKRPIAAFMYFSMDKREEAKRANPDLKTSEIAKVLGEMWRNVTSEEKAIFEQKAAADKERYAKEMDEYNAIKKSLEKVELAEGVKMEVDQS
eukprot:TRINITY_DN61622_c0_g1_i2.p1 TRINITY_DN61622_c0_g1~~TRINITY_DN61622_c0_g1_i2.p1  ORF type:complete len:665 (-),score=123.05 TRINITY_DN61622_c0_g1_i2:170-2164(-)